jgi:hypothetical protein
VVEVVEVEAGDQVAVVMVDGKSDKWMMFEGQSARAVNSLLLRSDLLTYAPFWGNLIQYIG